MFFPMYSDNFRKSVFVSSSVNGLIAMAVVVFLVWRNNFGGDLSRLSIHPKHTFTSVIVPFENGSEMRRQRNFYGIPNGSSHVTARYDICHGSYLARNISGSF
jgi:hypothetical protein